MYKIMIDPGHGRPDPGAVGPSGVQEKVVTLIVAKMLADILAPIAEVRLTRTEDVELAPGNEDLYERARLSNNWPADIFISIHCNSVASREAHGAEVWTTRGKTGADQLAEAIANSFKRNIPELALRVDMSDGDQDKEADFAVLAKTKCPAALVELAFISNPTEEALLELPTFQARAARTIAEGAAEYLGVPLPAQGGGGEQQMPEQWKLDIVQKAKQAGLITEDHNPDETATKWFVLAALLNCLKIMGR